MVLLISCSTESNSYVKPALVKDVVTIENSNDLKKYLSGSWTVSADMTMDPIKYLDNQSVFINLDGESSHSMDISTINDSSFISIDKGVINSSTQISLIHHVWSRK